MRPRTRRDEKLNNILQLKSLHSDAQREKQAGGQTEGRAGGQTEMTEKYRQDQTDRQTVR